MKSIDEYSQVVPLFGKLFIKFIGQMVKIKIKNKSILYLEELRSISEMIDEPLERVIMMQLMYEFTAMCTTIAMDMDGKPVHFRTMDWDLALMKQITIEVDFIKNDKTIFTAITYAGAVGVFTGLSKTNKYSIALNFRRVGFNIIKNLYRLKNDYFPCGYLIRYVLENEFIFATTLHILRTFPLVSPCYISLLSDTGEAYVLIRNRDDVEIQKSKLIKSSDDYLIQTNIDPDEKGANILWSIERLRLSKVVLEKQKYTTPQEILTNFLIFPILNHETIHGSIINPVDNEITTKIIV